MTAYVVGFLFSPDRLWVALIRKRKPEWQAGKINGIGGKIEPYENAHEAMVREFQEEAGIYVPEWRWFCRLRGRDGLVNFFETTGDLFSIRSLTDEIVWTVPVNGLNGLPLIPNLRWLIPLACDHSTNTLEGSFKEQPPPPESSSTLREPSLGPDNGGRP